MNQIYLDYAAATPMHDEVFVAMKPYFTDRFYNPSATYLAAVDVKKDLDSARARVAEILGAKPLEITFTAGGTEANNLAIRGVMDAFPGSKMLVSSIEHDSVREAGMLYDATQIPVHPDGIIDLEALRNSIKDDVVLISVMLANNEVGTLQPLTKICQLAASIRKDRIKNGNKTPLYVHTDACQAGLYLDLHVSRIGIDLLTLNGGKIYGPKQSGILYIKSGTNIKPIIVGGGQEKGKRSGTENIAFAIGFAKALEFAQAHREDESNRLRELRDYFIHELSEQIPEAQINGSLSHRLPNNVHLTIPGIDNERVLFTLDMKGVLAAAGSACSASSEEPSHVLSAMGLPTADIQSSLRFTLGKSTTKELIDTAIKTLKDIVNR